METPRPGFLEGVRDLTQKHGIVLVFDEIRTGFRMSLGGAQKAYGVTPDLACVGKAMANGYAISAVCGKADIMKKAEKDVFVSSTFFPNSDGYVAALKTLDIMQRDHVLDAIWKKGEALLARLRPAVEAAGVGAALSGIAPMFFITFAKDEEKVYRARRREFYTQLIRRGVFMQPYHHSYLCYRHTEEDIAAAAEAVESALAAVRDKIG
jgi:glutamate-1-semialdehyde aminotransferase